MNWLQQLHALGLWAQHHQGLMLRLLGAWAVLMIILACVHKVRQHTRRDTHGSARWATEREIRKAGLFR
jgi:type IV secretory pathway TraG/TraD family ATPase VirD4